MSYSFYSMYLRINFSSSFSQCWNVTLYTNSITVTVTWIWSQSQISTSRSFCIYYIVQIPTYFINTYYIQNMSCLKNSRKKSLGEHAQSYSFTLHFAIFLWQKFVALLVPLFPFVSPGLSVSIFLNHIHYLMLIVAAWKCIF